ncbi:hypothetical protein B0H14DRAFT_2646920 [Mycena olivaceomarginata]|nr:hypothetical protein B0H14DRAFT_2646920 [Mycena olivaceomarginata]
MSSSLPGSFWPYWKDKPQVLSPSPRNTASKHRSLASSPHRAPIQQQTQRRISGFLNEMNTWIGFNGDLPSRMAIEVEFWSLAGPLQSSTIKLVKHRVSSRSTKQDSKRKPTRNEMNKPSLPPVPTPALASSRQNSVPRRHITFVEECIAVNSPRRPPYNTSGSSSNSISEDSDANGTHAAWNGRTSGLRWAGDDESDDESNPGDWAGESAVSSDSDDDVLEVCLSCSRCNSSRDLRSSRSPQRRVAVHHIRPD